MTPFPHQQVFRLDAAVHAAVQAHNAKWRGRWERFLALAPPPRWQRGAPVSAEWRALYEIHLPVAEYVSSLRRLARLVLPHPSWIPAALALHAAHLATRSAHFASLLDLWSYLPPRLAETVTLSVDRLPALLAALADPPRFGTADGRYPGQLAMLRSWVRRDLSGPLAFLDVGSGTGEGTREAATALREAGHVVRAVGVTREPLEAWMAQAGCFPHREADCQVRCDDDVHFVAGEAAALPVQGRFAVILCNGLVGGRFVQEDTAFMAILSEFARLLAADGSVLMGCRFHAGRERHLARFRDVAAGLGWEVAGTNRDMVLQQA